MCVAPCTLSHPSKAPYSRFPCELCLHVLRYLGTYGCTFHIPQGRSLLIVSISITGGMGQAQDVKRINTNLILEHYFRSNCTAADRDPATSTLRADKAALSLYLTRYQDSYQCWLHCLYTRCGRKYYLFRTAHKTRVSKVAGARRGWKSDADWTILKWDPYGGAWRAYIAARLRSLYDNDQALIISICS